MVRCSTPDTLIGLGGGGSRVVYRFMEQEWILDEVLNNGPSEGNHGNDTLRATTIDTATDEVWHEDRANSVEQAVSDAIEASDYSPKDRYLEFEGPTIIPNELSRGWKNEQLTAPTSIRSLRNSTGLHSWWLKNGRDPLENVNNKGFDSGVNRLRSVSKALYHIADHSQVDPVNVRPEGEVCMVTSLGGGTGSGLAIDLATDLNDNDEVDDVHLYAVLPRSGAGIDIKTNAHAALSELEYAELNDESPFGTITLIPHLDAVSGKNTEFEMAVIRTIIARQNGGDELEKLRSKQDDQSHAPAYAPFTIASPVTLRYDFEAKERAKIVVEQTLDEKREELRNERDLHTAVEKYLKESFPNSAGAEIAGIESKGTLDFGDNGLQRAVQLKRRVEEDVWQRFLNSDALRVANLGDIVEEIDAEFAEICSDDSIGVGENADEFERAHEFVDVVPGRLQDPLREFGLTERAGSEYKLVEALKQELTNVAKRCDLYEAISRITAEENPHLSEKEAETIRTVLAEVVLDKEIKFPSKRIKNPKLRDAIEELENELLDLDGDREALEGQYQEVAGDIKTRRNRWYNEISDDAERLAAINRDKGTLNSVLKDLSREIDKTCRKINGAGKAELERITLNLDQIGPLGGEDESINGIAPINAKLEKVGLDRIPVDEIETGFEHLKRARKLEIEHGSGIFPDDNSEDFVIAANKANVDGWFTINENKSETSVEDEFSASFDGEKLGLTEEIEAAERDAIDAIAEGFMTTFTKDGSTFLGYESWNEEGVTVPQGSSPLTVRESLKSGLKATTETDENALLNDVMPVSDIEPNAPSTNPLPEEAAEESQNRAAMLQLVDAYLQPIRTEYEDADTRRTQLTDGEETPGLITQMKTLRGLAEGADAVDVDLPDPDDLQRSGIYGAGFVETYEGIYTFDLDDSFKYDDGENPYVVPMETKPTDLAGDPSDISDTDIVANRADEIETEFRRETARLKDNSERAPYEIMLRGNAEHTDGTEYTQLRIRQVYLSRGYSENPEVGSQYDRVYGEYNDRLGLPLDNNADMYNADIFPFGWGDDVSMITFVGGIFLDNIDLMSEANGYKDNYDETHSRSKFPGSHHTIGLGAMWDQWSAMGESVTDEWEAEFPDNDSDFGGFVYREQLYDPTNQKFIEEIMRRNQADDESATDLFLDALAVDAYENTIEIEEQEEKTGGQDFTV